MTAKYNNSQNSLLRVQKIQRRISGGFQGAVTRHPVNRPLPEMKWREASGDGVNSIFAVTADVAVIHILTPDLKSRGQRPQLQTNSTN